MRRTTAFIMHHIGSYISIPLSLESFGLSFFLCDAHGTIMQPTVTLLHSEWSNLYGVLAALSAIGLNAHGQV